MRLSNNRKSLILSLAILVVTASRASSQTNICNNPSQTQIVGISFASATTTQLVAAPAAGTGVASTRIIVCGYSFTMVGNATANSFKFQRGTGSNCGTGTNTVGGTYVAPAAATGVSVIQHNTPFFITAGNALCGTTTTGDFVGGTLVFAISPQ